MDALSSSEAVDEFAGQLGKSERGVGGDLQRWYRHLADFKAGEADPRILLEDLAALPHLGAPPLKRVFNELKSRVGSGDPMGFSAAKRMTARMDTRPDHRLSLSNIAYEALRDLVLFENLYRSALETSYSIRHLIWYANFTGNQKLLLELLSSPEGKTETRAEILGHLEKQGTSAEVLRKEYRRLIAEDPKNWYTREKYVEYLERIKAYKEAREVIETWLSERSESGGFDTIFARTALARVFDKEGRFEEGWAAIEPVVDSWQGGAMARAARLLDKLGRKDEAEDMARKAVGRYPDEPRIRTTLAELYWGHGKHAEAARLLKGAPQRLTTSDWMYTVAPAFVKMFTDRPQEGLAAFGAMLTQGLDHRDLYFLLAPVAKAKQAELAFRMASQLRWEGVSGDMVFRIEGYRYLKAWQGKGVAMDWLRKAIPVQLYTQASADIFGLGEYDLLWDLIENPDARGGAELVWMRRAAASALLGERKDPHRAELLAHYTNPGSAYYYALGRLLLGLASEGEVLPLATDPRKRCEVAFYVGVRAQGEGRYPDASDWFRISLETGQQHIGEYSWAHNTLTDWEGKNKSLPRLAAERSQDQAMTEDPGGPDRT
jgi:tetratricopeptide (TPR) repeat protein